MDEKSDPVYRSQGFYERRSWKIRQTHRLSEKWKSQTLASVKVISPEVIPMRKLPNWKHMLARERLRRWRQSCGELRVWLMVWIWERGKSEDMRMGKKRDEMSWRSWWTADSEWRGGLADRQPGRCWDDRYNTRWRNTQPALSLFNIDQGR